MTTKHLNISGLLNNTKLIHNTLRVLKTYNNAKGKSDLRMSCEIMRQSNVRQ